MVNALQLSVGDQVFLSFTQLGTFPAVVLEQAGFADWQGSESDHVLLQFNDGGVRRIWLPAGSQSIGPALT